MLCVLPWRLLSCVCRALHRWDIARSQAQFPLCNMHTLLLPCCRVEQLEKQQSENLERFKIRTKELKSSVAKELQEATLDAAGTYSSCM
jgi:hypothetical protein